MIKSNLEALAFPTIDKEQLESIGRCPNMVLRECKEGEKLFEAGQPVSNFFVVKTAEVKIVDRDERGERTIVVHKAGEFTGEVAQLTGKPPLVTAIVSRAGQVYEVTPDALRQLVNHHPKLGDMILQAFIARRQLLLKDGAFVGLRVIGSHYSKDTFRIREFLSSNQVPFEFVDVEDRENKDVLEVLKRFQLTEADTPVVACGEGRLCRNPTNRELADRLGLRQRLETAVYDLVVVGAGPAGLAAAVYGASEGLRTVLLERAAPGGQAGRSMRIENYLGFPMGITGSELTQLAVVQANKFGAKLSVTCPVLQLSFENTYSVLRIEDDETITSRCVLIATGAEYRVLGVEGCTQFEGRGVYYAATPMEAKSCGGQDVVVVGGGNSAGQAAVFLASQARKVYLLIRGNDLYKNMSSYLVQRIEQTSNIELMCNTEISRMAGDGYLSEIEIVNSVTKEARKLPVVAVFSFIGAAPRTDWLPAEIEKDPKQFVLTGPTLGQSPHWTSHRQPFLLETSRRGVFAAGDVRSGSVKRVASAVGEGSMAVQFVHEYLKEM